MQSDILAVQPASISQPATNPPEYNGYKVYWADGAQITPPHDSGIMAEVKAVTDYNEVKTMDRDQAIAAGLYQVSEVMWMMFISLS